MLRIHSALCLLFLVASPSLAATPELDSLEARWQDIEKSNVEPELRSLLDEVRAALLDHHRSPLPPRAKQRLHTLYAQIMGRLHGVQGQEALPRHGGPERFLLAPGSSKTEPVALEGADQCADAPLVELGSYSGSTLGGTRDGATNCAFASQAADVWYRVAPRTEPLFAQTRSTDFDSVLSFHLGCPPADLELVCNSTTPPLDIDAAISADFPGEDLYVRVSGVAGAEGSYTLDLGTGGSISGRLTTEQGEPLRDFFVSATTQPPFADVTVESGPDGRFEIGGLATRPYTVQVRSRGEFLGEVFDDVPCADGYFCDFGDATYLDVTLGENVEIGDIRLTRGGSIEGRLVDSLSGEPVEGILVEATRDDFVFFQSDVSEADGSYRLVGLPAGTYFVSTSAFGRYQNQVWSSIPCPFDCNPTDGNPIPLALGASVTNIDFQLNRTGTVRGTVTEAGTGAPLTKVVELLSIDGQTPSVQTSSQPGGQFQLGDVMPGRYVAVAGRPLNRRTHVFEMYDEIPCLEGAIGACDLDAGTVIEMTAGGEMVGIDFTLSLGGRIRGRISDEESGAPLEGVTVEAYTAEPVDYLTAVETGADGRYELTGLAGGDYLVRTVTPTDTHLDLAFPGILCGPASSCLNQATPVTVDFEQAVEGIDLALPRGSVLSGIVTESGSNQPVSGIRLLATRLDAFGSHQAETMPDGSYAVDGLFPGTYLLRTDSGGLYVDEHYDDVICREDLNCAERAMQLVVGLSDRLTGLDVQLSTGAVLTGSLRDRDGQPLEGQIRLREVADRVEATYPVNGDFEIDLLPAGDYSVVAEVFGHETQIWPGINCPFGVCPEAEPLTLTEGRPATASFRLDRLGVLRGRAFDAVTREPVGGLLEIFDATGQRVGLALAHDGHFLFEEARPGDHYLIFRPSLDHSARVFGAGACLGDGCQPLAGTAVPTDYGSVTDGLDIPLDRGGTLRGRLLAADGEGPSPFQHVVIYDENGIRLGPISTSNPWFIRRVPPGTYRLATSLGSPEYFNQVWPNLLCLPSDCPIRDGETVTLGPGQTLDLDFELDRVRSLTGRVVSATGQPLPGVSIHQRSRSGTLLGVTTTAADGRYRLSLLRERSYVVALGAGDRPSVLWPDQVCDGECLSVLDSGQLVQPDPSGDVENIDFSLPSSSLCASSDQLCLTSERFTVTAEWATDEESGTGRAFPVTGDSGYFWFFGPDNVEVVVKVLDACDAFDRFWVFAAGLTNVRVDLRVEDRLTGNSNLYTKPAGPLFEPILDTAAFETCSIGRPAPSAPPAAPSPPPAIETSPAGQNPEKMSCQPSATAVCLNGGRFRAEARWQTLNADDGRGFGVPLTDDTTYFWFFGPDNIEVVLKVLDACDAFGHFWVFAGGLTNVEVDLTVTEVATGRVWSSRNPLGTDFAPIADTAAFTCSGSGAPNPAR